MKAMLFAAGLGTRLQTITAHRPKALVAINGQSLLEINIKYLQSFQIFDVVVNVHHYADQIIDLLEKNNGFGSRITISDERDQLLETGGGLKKASIHLENEPAYLVMNVDVITDINISNLWNTHVHSGATATLAVMQRSSSRQLLFNDQMELCGWEHKEKDQTKIAKTATNYIPFAFSGIQITSNKIFENSALDGKFSMIDLYLEQAAKKLIKGYDHSNGVFLDVGKPEAIAKAESLLKNR